MQRFYMHIYLYRQRYKPHSFPTKVFQEEKRKFVKSLNLNIEWLIYVKIDIIEMILFL